MAEKILRLSKVKETVGLGRTSIYRLMQAGQFPRPVQIGLRAVGWRESDIQAWIESRHLAIEARGLAKRILAEG